MTLSLPEPELHFPVQAPYRVASDLSKLEGLPLARDSHFKAYIAAKLKLMAQRPDTLLLPQVALGENVWEEIWQQLGLDQDASVQALGLDPQFRASSAIPASLNAALLAQHSRAQQLSLAMQEDWVLISPQGLFEAGSVCFPSGWVPGEKFGLSLAEIHAPVADGEALRKASQALTRAMLQKGPFQRFVWTLARNKSLSRHPLFAEDIRAESAQALYFRYERQTTVSLPRSGRALFLIRIYVVPLDVALAGPVYITTKGMSKEMSKEMSKGMTEGISEVIEECTTNPVEASERLATLKASLSSMSEAVIAYKGLGEIREQVLALA
jgi:hypothetical protein